MKCTSSLQHKISDGPVYYAVLVVKRAIRDGRDTLLAGAQGTEAGWKDVSRSRFAMNLHTNFSAVLGAVSLNSSKMTLKHGRV